EWRAVLGRPPNRGWQPVVAWREEGEGGRKALDFAPYPLRHLEAAGAALEPCESVSQAAERYFEALESLGGHSALREQVRAALAEMRGREERRLAALQEQLQRAEASEELRRKGEYLLGYMHTLTPGQRVLALPDEKLTIALDPALTPVENAQAYFKE